MNNAKANEPSESGSLFPLRAVRALGRLVIVPAHRFFFVLGEMSLLLGATLVGIFRGVTLPSERIGVEPLVF